MTEKISNSLVFPQPSPLQGCSRFGDVVLAVEAYDLTGRRGAILDYISWVEEKLLEEGIDERVTICNHLVDGLYYRTMRVPAGVTFTGARHLKAGLVLLQEGSLSILTEHGGVDMTAPYVTTSKPCAGKLGYAHTDVVWTNVFATTKTTLEDIEQELFSLE